METQRATLHLLVLQPDFGASHIVTFLLCVGNGGISVVTPIQRRYQNQSFLLKVCSAGDTAMAVSYSAVVLL